MSTLSMKNIYREHYRNKRRSPAPRRDPRPSAPRSHPRPSAPRRHPPRPSTPPPRGHERARAIRKRQPKNVKRGILTKTIKKKWNAAKNVINEGRSFVSAGRKEVRNNGYKGLVNSAKPFFKGAGKGMKEAEHKNILKHAAKAGLKGAAKGAVKGAIVGSILGPKGAVINGARTGLKSGVKKAGLSLLLSYGKEAYNGGKDAYREHRSANQGYEMDTFMDMSEDNLEYVGSRVPTKVVWKDGRFQRVNDWDNAKKPIWVSPSRNPYAKESYSSGYPSWHTDEDEYY